MLNLVSFPTVFNFTFKKIFYQEQHNEIHNKMCSEVWNNILQTGAMVECVSI